MKTNVIKVKNLARVEGEGTLYLRLQEGNVREARLDIFEPPRFFEAFLRGRKYSEVPDITARICGICPVAYQMSSVQALEDLFGFTIDESTRLLRRLLYCGEWIESHVLHVFMLHAPDFLGYDDALQMAKDHPEIVQRGLRMKKIGNALVRLLGGREIHPVNVRVGGFYRLPTRSELTSLLDELHWGRDAAIETSRFVSGLEFPELEMEYEYVALRHPTEYPMNEGRIVSSSGLDISPREYELYFEERQVSYSTALHSFEKGRGAYVVGPLSRFTLNHDKLPEVAREVSASIGLIPPVKNPFRSIIVRCIETIVAFEEAIRIINRYEPPTMTSRKEDLRAGTGFGTTEAPRGLLYHRYRVGDDGLVRDAKIVPPTAQNQPSIEMDLSAFAQRHITLPVEILSRKCEQAVRNYDPCISCSTHFLTLDIQHSG
jgi:coenzyme F420-reducing hydrogenase alpha subunit